MSDLEKQFGQHVLQKLSEANVAEETRQDIAELIAMMATSNGSPDDVYTELTGLAGDILSLDFIKGLFADYQHACSSLDASSAAQDASSAAQGGGDVAISDNDTKPVQFNSNAPSFRPSFKSRGGGVSKKPYSYGRAGHGALNGMNQANIQRALVDLLSGNAGGGANSKKIRCKNFPHCTQRECRFVHPTKMCYQYPNCPNEPGTCTYLHPGEDDALIAEYEKVKQEASQRRLEEQAKIEQQNGIGICKKGSQCFTATCKFGHPTPANESNEVSVFEWCSDGKNCANSGCLKAHPSYKSRDEILGSRPPRPRFGNNNNNSNSIAKLVSALTQQPVQEEKSLEQCKFGKRCMNPRCRYRHASTPVVCRDGSACTRIDCYFSHPLNQECKYGVNCKNKHCLFKHPEGRDQSLNKPLVWTKNTNERQFAVEEGDVLEKAPPQEDTSMAA